MNDKKTKRGLVEVDAQLLAGVAPLFEGAGLTIVGSLDSGATGRLWYSHSVCLVVEGDALPDECSSGGRLFRVNAVVHTKPFDAPTLSFSVGNELTRETYLSLLDKCPGHMR